MVSSVRLQEGLRLVSRLVRSRETLPPLVPHQNRSPRLQPHAPAPEAHPGQPTVADFLNSPRHGENLVARQLLSEGGVTPDAINRVQRRWAPLRATTRYNYHASLRSILASIAPLLVPLVIRVTAPHPRNRTASPEELAAVLAHSGCVLRCAVLLCYDCALRGGTAATVAPRHWRQGRLVLHTKFGDHVDTEVTARLNPYLELATAGLTAIGRTSVTTPFLSLLSGGVYSHEMLQAHFAQLCHRLGISGLTLHDLRRTAARAKYAETHDLRDVQSLLSHRRLQSSLHYLDAGLDTGRKATGQ